LDSITDESGHSVAHPHYNLIGQMDSLKLGQSGPGQLTLAYQYHFQGWVQDITAKKATSDTVYHQRLKYEDGAAPRFDGSIAEYNYSLVQGATKRYLFGYDPLDRMTQAVTNLTSPSLVDGGTWGYQYADNGAINRMSNLNQAFQYAYVQGNQLDHVVATGMPPIHDRSSTANFVYDAAGRMVVDESKGMDIDYDNTTGLASAFHVAGGSLVSSFYMAYDDQGMRVSKMQYQNSTEVAAKHYTGFGKEIRHGAAGWQEVYPFEGYGRKVKDSSGVWETEAYVKNHLGSTVKVYNLSGSAESYSTDYEPYGKLRLQTVSANTEVTPKFTGKEFDEGLELDYFGARYYDPELGMWISPDPARQFASPYAYSPNPVNSVDPDGNYFTTEEGYLVFDAKSAGIHAYQGVASGPEWDAFQALQLTPVALLKGEPIAGSVNLFGHIAIEVGDLAFSFGTNYSHSGLDRRDWGTNLSSYLDPQNAIPRNTFSLDLHLSQDDAIRLRNYYYNNVPNIKNYSSLRFNCSNAVANGLESIGYTNNHILQTPSDLYNNALQINSKR
jgi:RHS repeat-associated protein